VAPLDNSPSRAAHAAVGATHRILAQSCVAAVPLFRRHSTASSGRFVAKYTEAEPIKAITCEMARFVSKECGTAVPEFVTSGDDGALPGVVRSDGHACEHFSTASLTTSSLPSLPSTTTTHHGAQPRRPKPQLRQRRQHAGRLRRRPSTRTASLPPPRRRRRPGRRCRGRRRVCRRYRLCNLRDPSSRPINLP
jgi:hypothetical protein